MRTHARTHLHTHMRTHTHIHGRVEILRESQHCQNKALECVPVFPPRKAVTIWIKLVPAYSCFTHQTPKLNEQNDYASILKMWDEKK